MSSSLASVLPVVNATLNLTTAVLLLAGLIAIRRGQIARHRRLMLLALSTSVVFLISYLARVALTGTHRFPVEGTVKTVYLTVLASHTVLAAILLPLVLRTLYLGLRRSDAKHRRIARVTWPVWIYVSATGVLVYVLLYQVAPQLQLAGSQ